MAFFWLDVWNDGGKRWGRSLFKVDLCSGTAVLCEDKEGRKEESTRRAIAMSVVPHNVDLSEKQSNRF